MLEAGIFHMPKHNSFQFPSMKEHDSLAIEMYSQMSHS